MQKLFETADAHSKPVLYVLVNIKDLMIVVKAVNCKIVLLMTYSCKEQQNTGISEVIIHVDPHVTIQQLSGIPDIIIVSVGNIMLYTRSLLHITSLYVL